MYPVFVVLFKVVLRDLLYPNKQKIKNVISRIQVYIHSDPQAGTVYCFVIGSDRITLNIRYTILNVYR